MIKWNEVTWYSKAAAGVFFILILPPFAFYIGMRYAALAAESASTPSVQITQKTDTQEAKEQPASDDGSECGNLPQQPMNICLAEKDDAADAEMAKVLAATLAWAKGFDEGIEPGQPSQFQATQASQKAWLAYRLAECTAQANTWEGGSGQPAIYNSCYLDLTNARIKALKDLENI